MMLFTWPLWFVNNLRLRHGSSISTLVYNFVLVWCLICVFLMIKFLTVHRWFTSCIGVSHDTPKASYDHLYLFGFGVVMYNPFDVYHNLNLISLNFYLFYYVPLSLPFLLYFFDKKISLSTTKVWVLIKNRIQF